MKTKTTKNMEEKINEFFQISGESKTASTFLNNQLMTIPKNTLIEAFHLFKLEPVYMYLTEEHLKEGKTDWNISGYVRYIDMYLLEMSGGKRTELVRVGEDLTGKRPTSFSSRLLRIEIISLFLQKILQQSN